MKPPTGSFSLWAFHPLFSTSVLSWLSCDIQAIISKIQLTNESVSVSQDYIDLNFISIAVDRDVVLPDDTAQEYHVHTKK